MFIQKPVVSMRENPSHDEEVVSQILFGEEVEVSQKCNGWAQIVTPDRYSGWVPSSLLVNRKYHPTLFTSQKAVPVFDQKDIRKGSIMTLPFGVGLEAMDDTEWVEIRDIGYIKRGHLTEKIILIKENIPKFSKFFLDIPYIWGGRSSFGYDCSGFIQMLYMLMGVHLPRDAKLQFPIFSERKDPEAGDLIFWGKDPEHIEHVGMYLGEGTFIHASNQEQMPWVRISHVHDFVWNPKTSPIYPFWAFRKF